MAAVLRRAASCDEGMREVLVDRDGMAGSDPTRGDAAKAHI